MKGWVKITLLVVGILIVVSAFYYAMFSSVFEGAPAISQHSYLELNIVGNVAERGGGEPFAKIFQGEMPTMQGLLSCIRKAKIDPKIKGIILRPFGSDIGWAKTEELRAALKDFESSDKPVYVYLEAAGNREYYLSSVGTMIFGSPTGILFLNGLMGNAYFFKGTLDKIGVEADFVVHGKYKSAPEIVTRKNMSPANREVVNSLLDDYTDRFIQSISADRHLNPDDTRKLINQGLFSIKEAQEAGLVDTLMYYNEFKDYLKAKDNRRPRFVSYGRYKKVSFKKLGVKPKSTFALIYGVGNIVSGIGDGGVQDGVITSEGMANAIRKAAKDKQVKAIVLRIDSPGGSGTASDIIWREVVEARKKKPVIVSMSDVAASGGYYISMAADSIVAEPSSLVGSIGVFAGKFAMKNFYRKLGINKEEIPKTANADLFSEYHKFSPAQRQLLQHNIDSFYQIFVSKVAEGRHKSYAEIDKIAQGRVWTGNQGLKIGLVDRLGGLYEAFQIAKKMTNIPLDAYVNVKILPRRKSFLERLMGRSLDARVSSDLLTRLLPADVLRYVTGFVYFQNYEPLYLMPYYIDVK